MQSQIFKLFFFHDLRLNAIEENDAAKTAPLVIGDFLKPDPTYSRFHFSGTDLKTETFGFSNLASADDLIGVLEKVFSGNVFNTPQGFLASLREAIPHINTGEWIVISEKELPVTLWGSKRELKKLIEQDAKVLVKIPAKNGFDLELYSKKNIYQDFFIPIQNMLPEAFRFFSINGKKLVKERQFYFETWTLHKPPHGFEEVFPETVF